MKIERIKVAELSLDPSNVRKHSRRNLDAIKASLRKFGQQKPIVVDAKGIVLAGNGTLTAAQELGWTEIQIVRTELAGVEATAFAIADNRTAELAEWEEDKLSQVLQSLKVEDADLLAATGYDAAEVDKMSKAEVTEDEVPEPPAEPITKPGDLWILGNHRLLCGDSTKADGFGDHCRVLIFDPPWDAGISMVAKKSTLAFCDGQRASDIVTIFGAPTWIFAWDCVSSWYTPSRPLRRMKLCLWYGDLNTYNQDGSHYGEPGEARTVTNTRGSYEYTPDPRGKHLSDLFSAPITKLHAESDHSHAKPVAWIRMLIGNCTDGDIYDPFCGSGTTLIAAEQLGRKCYGMEISPQYCDVIVKRWENLTGKKAVLDKPTT
jgi:hypothetical protein